MLWVQKCSNLHFSMEEPKSNFESYFLKQNSNIQNQYNEKN